MNKVSPWQGFWQILTSESGEGIQPFRNTTVAERAGHGFVLYTATCFMELRITAKRDPPADWPPTQQELTDMFRAFHAIAGRCTWMKGETGWRAEHEIIMASDSRLEDQTAQYTFTFDKNGAVCQRLGGRESWRRLSGAGTSPLSGAWELVTASDKWLYLTSAGHYAVMRADHKRPLSMPNADELSDEAVFALSTSFGANAGARLETAGSFDHWPMIGQVFGYEARKHETFKLERVEEERFTASLPPLDIPADEWQRLE